MFACHASSAEDDSNALNQQINQLIEQGKYQEAIPIAEKVVETAKRTRGPEHPETADALNLLGLLFQKIGEYAKAEPLVREALGIQKRVLGSEHPDTAFSLNNLGELYQATGEYTSSTAAVTYGHGGRSQPFTEADWSDPGDRTDSSAYERSKMIAERAAWDWHAREGNALELVAVCPGAVLGPVLGGAHSASLNIVKRLIDGSLPGLPRFGWPLAEVRDIADLHVRALRAPNAAGQRYIGAGPFYWMRTLPVCCVNACPR